MLWRNKHLTTGVFLELDKYFCFATCRILFALLTQIPAIWKQFDGRGRRRQGGPPAGG
jgi:hypothetical protein